MTISSTEIEVILNNINNIRDSLAYNVNSRIKPLEREINNIDNSEYRSESDSYELSVVTLEQMRSQIITLKNSVSNDYTQLGSAQSSLGRLLDRLTSNSPQTSSDSGLPSSNQLNLTSEQLIATLFEWLLSYSGTKRDMQNSLESIRTVLEEADDFEFTGLSEDDQVFAQIIQIISEKMDVQN